jgi:hypothetical protein
VGISYCKQCIEFLLQVWKQWEDSAMILASNKQQQKEKHK